MFDLGGTIGGLLFIRLVAPQGLKLMGAREAHAVEGRCFRLVRVSLATALFALLGWLALEASDMSGAANAADVLAAIPTVLLGTSFGHDLFVQALSVFAALVLVTARPRRWRCVAVGLAGLALALQARTATPSPWSIAPSLLLYAEGLHLVAAVLGSEVCCRCLSWYATPRRSPQPRR